MLANVTVLGEAMHYRFPPKHEKTLAELQAALVKHSFPAKLAGRLCTRHAFVRAFRKWLTALHGADVNHSTSGYHDHVTEDSRSTKKQHGVLRFQVDTVDTSSGQCRYGFYCTVEIDKVTGSVTASDAAIEAAIQGQLPHYRERKHKADLNRLMGRVERHLIKRAVGLVPYGGNWFVPAGQKPMLDAWCAFLVEIGGIVTFRAEEVVYTPAAVPPAPVTPSTPTAPALPSVPVNPHPAAVAVSDRLAANLAEIERIVYSVCRDDWQGKAKAKARKEAEAYDWCESTLSDLAQYHDWLGIQREILADRAAALKYSLDNPGTVPALPKEEVTYIPDPADDISVIEVVSSPVADAPALPDALLGAGKPTIHWDWVKRVASVATLF